MKTKMRMASRMMRTTIVTALPAGRDGTGGGKEHTVSRSSVIGTSAPTGRTVLLGLVRERVEPPSSPTQAVGRPIDLAVRLLEQLVVNVELVADLERQVVLPGDGRRQVLEPRVLLCGR